MTSKIIYWSPRVLSVCFIVFLSLFSFDVFGEYIGWEVLLALLMHLVPSLVLLVLTIIAWKHDLVGAVVYLAAAIGYVLLVGFDRPGSWYLGISGPAALVGILFLLSWRQRKNGSL